MRICITILLLIISINNAFTQSTDEFNLLKKDCCEYHSADNRIIIPDGGQGLINQLFFVYKAFFSSQDHHSCVFTPSCSEYSVQSIRKQGLIMGTFDTLDRLTRCHGLRPQDYSIDENTKRLSDPVKNIRNDEL